MFIPHLSSTEHVRIDSNKDDFKGYVVCKVARSPQSPLFISKPTFPQLCDFPCNNVFSVIVLKPPRPILYCVQTILPSGLILNCLGF